jgi:hypothetical protein
MCVLLALGVYFPLFNHELISLISAVAPPGERHVLVTQMKTRMAMVNSSAPVICVKFLIQEQERIVPQ